MEFLLSATAPNWLTIILAVIAVIATIIIGIKPYNLQKRQNSDYIKRKKLLLIQDFENIIEQINKVCKFCISKNCYIITATSQNDIELIQIKESIKLNYVDFLVLYDKTINNSYVDLIDAVDELRSIQKRHSYGKGTIITVTNEAKTILELENDIIKLIK